MAPLARHLIVDDRRGWDDGGVPQRRQRTSESSRLLTLHGALSFPASHGSGGSRPAACSWRPFNFEGESSEELRRLGTCCGEAGLQVAKSHPRRRQALLLPRVATHISPVIDAGSTPLSCPPLRNWQFTHPDPPAAAAWPETSSVAPRRRRNLPLQPPQATFSASIPCAVARLGSSAASCTLA